MKSFPAVLFFVLVLTVFSGISNPASANKLTYIPSLVTLPKFDTARVMESIDGEWREAGIYYAAFSDNNIMSLTYDTLRNNSWYEQFARWELHHDSYRRLVSAEFINSDYDPVTLDSFFYDEQTGRLRTQRREYWRTQIDFDVWKEHWVKYSNYVYDNAGGPVHIEGELPSRFIYNDAGQIFSIIYTRANDLVDTGQEIRTYDEQGYLKEILYSTRSNHQDEWKAKYRMDFFGTHPEAIEPSVVLVEGLLPIYVVPLDASRSFWGYVTNTSSEPVRVFIDGLDWNEFRGNEIIYLDSGQRESFHMSVWCQSEGNFYDTLTVKVQTEKITQYFPLHARTPNAASVTRTSHDDNARPRVVGSRLELNSGVYEHAAQEVIVYDVTGRVMLTDVKPGQWVDLSMLPRDAVYMVFLRQRNGDYVSKKIML